MAVVLVLSLEYVYSMWGLRAEVAYKVALYSELFSQKLSFFYMTFNDCIFKPLQRYICSAICAEAMNARLALVAVITTAMLLAPPVVIADDTQDIPTNAQNTGVHDSLVAALAHAGLVEALQGQGPFTVFAPTDDAFAAAGIDLTTFDTEEENATLVDILTYHVYPGSVEAAQVTDGMTATMLNGDDATFTVTNGVVMVGDATVTTADVMASNGIIHVIDKVLMPPADLVDIPTVAQSTGIHDSLVAAVIQAELLSTLQGDGPFTVFAPTDDAFTAAGVDLAALDNEEGKAALTDILLYHVVSGAVPSSAVTDGMVAAAVNGDDLTFTVGEGVMVNDANVILADVMASNGIIHVIDKVLMPPADLVDIPTVAQSTGIHNTLVDALSASDLVTTLQGDGPFTVFAPTDQAFADAGIDMEFIANQGELIYDILLYHVVSGEVPSSAVTDGLVAGAVNGDDLTFSVGEGVMVNDANVVLADVPASNGVIHVIDKVLMPPAEVDTSECDVIIGIDDTGLAYDKPYVEVEVGATVCWIWNDESMAHNVAQIAVEGDTTRYMSGVYSGESMKSVDFRYTFDVDQTFNYICVPHATSGMAGQIVVGEGSIVEPEEESNNTPGFSAGIAALAVIGALMIAGRRLR
jgi:uncharacterized surface protein with fasciclin (FAS1) repeats